MDCLFNLRREKIMENKFTIAGYYGPHPAFDIKDKDNNVIDTAVNTINDETYKLLADAGINLIVALPEISYDKNPELTIKNLELGEKYGIRMCINDRRITNDTTDEELAEYMEPYRHYKSFYGINVKDEPSTDEYMYSCGGPERRMHNFYGIMKLLKRNNVFGYMNLHPYQQHMGTKTAYKKMLKEYADNCDPQIISHDHYVFDDNANCRHTYCERYFYNLKLIKETADAAGIPMWSFVQAGAQFNDSMRNIESIPHCPSESQTMWIVNVSLLFGAKAIQFFPLIQPRWFAFAPNGELDCDRNGVIGADGKPNRMYPMVKRASKWIKAIEDILVPAKHLAVIAKGFLPENFADILTDSYGPVKSLEIDDKVLGSMVGVFDYNGKYALMVLNYNDSKEADVVLNLDKEYKMAVITEEGKTEDKAERKVISLGAGSAALVVLD